MLKNVFYFNSKIVLAEGRISDIEVLRTGVIQDRGFEITHKMLEEYVQNFKDNVYGTEVQVNLEHNRGSEAAGWIKDLYIASQSDGTNRLMAKVEWTELGHEKVSKNLFKFVSAELASDYPHHETGKLVKNVFIGLALTNTPALKGQQPVSLADKLIQNRMIKKMLAELKKRKFVTAEDKALVKTLLEDMPEGEEKAEATTDAATVDAMPTEPEKTEEEKVAEAKAVEDKAKTDAAAATAAGDQQLQENPEFKALSEKNKTLTEKVERMELTEVVDGFMVSNKKTDANGMTTGFTGAETKEKVITFMLGLAPAQRETFKTLVALVQTVDLATKGQGKGADGEDDGAELEDKMVKYAEKCLADGKAKNIEEAQKMAHKKFKTKDSQE